MNIVIVDHRDSFTGNLYQDLGATAGATPRVIDSRDERLLELADGGAGSPDLWVLSAGPGHPARGEDSGLTPVLLARMPEASVVFGVCLGLQLMVHAAGGDVVTAREIVHGQPRTVHHEGRGIFRGLPRPVAMMRYHSLVADARTLPAEYRTVAWSEDGEIMAVEHRLRRWTAVQFHPESIGSPDGRRLLANVVAAARNARARSAGGKNPEEARGGPRPAPSIPARPPRG